MGLWTVEHVITILPAFVIFIGIAILVGWLLRDKSEKIRRIPLQVIAVILIGLEIAKQIEAGIGGYDLYALPFHYCSLFLYLLPLHAFIGGRFRKYVNAATLGCLASLFFFMLVMPAIVYSEYNIIDFFGSFGSFHTVTFHNLVILYFVLTLSLKLYEFNIKRDLSVMAIFLAIYVVIATVLSHTLKTNFHNLYKCNLAPVEDIRLMMVDKLGWFGQAIYVAVLFILTIIFAYIAYFLCYLVLKLIETVKARICKKES